DIQHTLAGGKVARVTDRTAVAHRLGEGIAELPRYTVRRALGDVRLKRMVGRTAAAIDQIDRSVLRTDDDKVLRESGVQQQCARLSVVCCPRRRLGVIDVARQPADVAVGDPAIGGGGSAKSLSCRQSIYADGPNRRSKVHTVEDLVHQRNVV